MTGLLDDLATAALLGTERRPPAPPEPQPDDPALDAALAAQPWDADPAGALLAAAALAATHLRAGIAAPRLEADPDATAAPAQATPPASAIVAALLPRLTADADGLAHLPELLARVAARGEHVPPTALPALLDRGRADRALRPLVLRAGDARAVWLATQNPDWAWAADDAPGDGAEAGAVWQTGGTAARTVLLADLRAADPAAARELVAATWAEDPPEARAAFLQTFHTNLDHADEPLLETALDDRRKEVRAAAIALLAGLSGSALQRRNAERLAKLVTVGRRLDVALPELPLDAATARDRDAEPGQARIGGRRAAALADLVAHAGLAFWPEPARAIRLAERTDFAAALNAGWVRAARAAADPAWLTALAEHGKDITLLAPLAPTDADATAVRLVGGRGPVPLRQVDHLPGPWSAKLSAAIVRRATDEPAATDRPLLRVLSTRLHPDALSGATDLYLNLGAADLLDLRLTMIRELPLP